MTNGEVTDLMYKVFLMTLQLAGPILVISMVVGIIISILQAATQIHEQTLTFVPKLLVIGIILWSPDRTCFSPCRNLPVISLP